MADRKKIKLDLGPIFTEFRKNEHCMKDLKYAITAVNEGFNRMNFILIKINDANPRTPGLFSRATCSEVLYENETFVAGSVFQKGVDVLEQYVETEQMKVPADESQRKALEKLLLFLTEDHAELFPKDCEGKEKLCDGREGMWALTVAEHLLSKLAVDDNYIMAKCYSDLPPDSLHKLTGKIGDTSFGCEQGWHGSVDILMDGNLPVHILKDQQDFSGDSVSSFDIKTNNNFDDADNQNQLLAQTIVFSFLQMKYNRLKLRHSLIPSIGIGTKHLCINLYDCINDVFLSSDTALEMIGECGGKRKVLVEIVVLLWLTVNYRYFCTGVTKEMKMFKADFHRRVDDMINVYFDEVKRPVYVSDVIENNNHKTNWAASGGKRAKKMFEKNEYFEI